MFKVSGDGNGLFYLFVCTIFIYKKMLGIKSKCAASQVKSLKSPLKLFTERSIFTYPSMYNVPKWSDTL